MVCKAGRTINRQISKSYAMHIWGIFNSQACGFLKKDTILKLLYILHNLIKSMVISLSALYIGSPAGHKSRGKCYNNPEPTSTSLTIL